MNECMIIFCKIESYPSVNVGYEMENVVGYKLYERQFNDYLSLLIYATIQDNIDGGGNDDGYSELIYQSFGNLMKEKKDRCYVKNRFTIQDQVRQHLLFLFKKMIEESKNINLEMEEDTAKIITKLAAANADCYSEFMFTISPHIESKFGPALKSASDNNWFISKMIEHLSKDYTSMNITITIMKIGVEFDKFLRKIAWLLGQYYWVTKASITDKIFEVTLLQQGMTIVMIYGMTMALRPKIIRPKKKPTKKSDPKPQGLELFSEVVAQDQTSPTEELINDTELYI
jgi:hypothetical protein